MSTPRNLCLRAFWGGRKDSLTTQIDMVWTTFRRLSLYGHFMADEWRAVFAGFQVVSQSRELLESAMTAEYHNPEGVLYMLTQLRFDGDHHRPILDFSAAPNHQVGYERLVANSAILDFLIENDDKTPNPNWMRWVLGIGADLVRMFVDVWNPDVVSLGSRELHVAQLIGYPPVGYLSWLSDDVQNPGVDQVASRFNEPYKNGIFLGVDPSSPTMVEDALSLIAHMQGRGLLRPIPFIQGQPHPV